MSDEMQEHQILLPHGIRKTVIKAAPDSQNEGGTPERLYEDGTKVVFHFVTRHGSKVVDDSRKWADDQKMELVFGKKFKFEAWEMCLQTMREGEVAKFFIPKTMTGPYPAIAKVLRDNYGRKHGSKKKPPSHLGGCMMHNMQGLGHDDLNAMLKSPVDLEFTIKVLEVILDQSKAIDPWLMSRPQQLDYIQKLKEEGNAAFKEENFKEAMDKYNAGLYWLDRLLVREKPGDEEWLVLRDRKTVFTLNLCQCQLVTKDYYSVISQCNEILSYDPENCKALFRLAKANVGVGNFDEAEEDFKKLSELDPSLQSKCNQEIKAVLVAKQKAIQDESEFAKKYFKA